MTSAGNVNMNVNRVALQILQENYLFWDPFWSPNLYFSGSISMINQTFWTSDPGNERFSVRLIFSNIENF